MASGDDRENQSHSAESCFRWTSCKARPGNGLRSQWLPQSCKKAIAGRPELHRRCNLRILNDVAVCWSPSLLELLQMLISDRTYVVFACRAGCFVSFVNRRSCSVLTMRGRINVVSSQK